MNGNQFDFLEVVQNDEVKEEITNDEEGIPLIARCVYQPNLDVVRIRRPALRIIDAISFASDLAIQQIKENDLLMDYIKELSDKADEEDKTKMPEVNRILWKTAEEEFILEQGPIEKFDIMISYCQEDRHLAKKLSRRLKESNSYLVSFDDKNRHSWDPKAMAKAVEGSTIMIMCFSSQYRNSYGCRLEAEYAAKRGRPIIPVKISEYEPTGWLKDIIGTKTPTDFTRESNTAYAQIIEKINAD